MTHFEIIVEGEELADIQTFFVARDSTVREIIAEVASKTGIPPDDALLFLEDEDEPLDPEGFIDDKNSILVHHVHGARQIHVVIHYNGKSKEKNFPPSARVQRVLIWAVSKAGFNIDPAIAAEMELALHSDMKELPRNAHIGRYVKRGHKLSLDLIRGVVPNGKS